MWSRGLDRDLDYVTGNCPGELECFQLGETGKPETRQGTRCVRPGYKENFCGKYSTATVEMSDPPEDELLA